ncbi:hypothetical protein DMENIID0001_091250 [Sergentomyia squamirostris]
MNNFIGKSTSNHEDEELAEKRGKRGKPSFNKRQDDYRRRVGADVMKRTRGRALGSMLITSWIYLIWLVKRALNTSQLFVATLY